MNRRRDLDQQLIEWLDDGADAAPERFVWAALEEAERVPQRDAWLASAEEILMQLKRAAPVLGIAAAIVLAIVAFQLVGLPRIGTDDPEPRTYTERDLESIIVTESNAPADITVSTTRQGRSVLFEPLAPGGAAPDTSDLVAAITSELDVDGSGYATWGAVFETEAAAMEAYDFLAAEHDEPEGWGIEGTTPDPPIGDESRTWTGQQYDFESARTLFWRQDNLLLAVIGWFDWTDEGVRDLADILVERAR